jgi:DNA adenine methylase
MVNNRHIYSPLRYPGGKGCIFPFVAKLFYENDLIGVSYAEPYAGGSGLALRLLFEGYVEKIYLNDIDKSVHSFWNSILSEPDDFCQWIKNVKVDVKRWKHYKELITSEGASEFEVAQAFFFLNRTNVSGIIKGGIIGGLDQHGSYKIDARFNKQDLIHRIQKIAELKDRIILSNKDGIDFLRRLDKTNEQILIFLDPPYFCKGADLYMNFYTEKDHKALSKQVSRLKKRWLVSYDNQPFILNLYSEYKTVAHNLSQCASNRIGKEVLVFSDKLQYSRSLKLLNSPVLV